MPARLLVAYSLIALMAAAAAAGLWWLKTRTGRAQRTERQRQDAWRSRVRDRGDTPH